MENSTHKGDIYTSKLTGKSLILIKDFNEKKLFRTDKGDAVVLYNFEVEFKSSVEDYQFGSVEFKEGQIVCLKLNREIPEQELMMVRQGNEEILCRNKDLREVWYSLEELTLA